MQTRYSQRSEHYTFSPGVLNPTCMHLRQHLVQPVSLISSFLVGVVCGYNIMVSLFFSLVNNRECLCVLSCHWVCICFLTQSCPTLCGHMYIAQQVFCPWNFPRRKTGVGCHFLLQGIFLTQGSNPHPLCLLHWQVGLLPLAPPGNR